MLGHLHSEGAVSSVGFWAGQCWAPCRQQMGTSVIVSTGFTGLAYWCPPQSQGSRPCLPDQDAEESEAEKGRYPSLLTLVLSVQPGEGAGLATAGQPLFEAQAVPLSHCR